MNLVDLMQRATLPKTTTENGAVSLATTGSALVDYFSKCGTYAGRSQDDVDRDMRAIFAEDPTAALRLVFGARLITRKPTGYKKAQTGLGRKDEFYKSIIWLLKNRPEAVYSNLHLVPLFGSWKDLLQDPLLSLIDTDKLFPLLKENLDDNLLLKYLPSLRSKARSPREKVRLMFVKLFRNYLKIDERQYRALKKSGKGHEWLQQMSSGQWDRIEFNKIPGRALANHMKRHKKGQEPVLYRHGLKERLIKWVAENNKFKFSGYVHELFLAFTDAGHDPIKLKVLDGQFETLIAPFRGHRLGNILCCVDTSGSMSSCVGGSKKLKAIDVSVSLGIAFSAVNIGFFQNTIVEFEGSCRLHKLNGAFSQRASYVQQNVHVPSGSTNFDGVVNLLVRLRQEHPEIPVEEYPQTILAVSDMQFNRTGSSTAHESAVRKLAQVGLNPRFIWWNVADRTKDFQVGSMDKGTYVMSGFDPANVLSLLGMYNAQDGEAPVKAPETPLEGLVAFLSQPIFDLIK